MPTIKKKDKNLSGIDSHKQRLLLMYLTQKNTKYIVKIDIERVQGNSQVWLSDQPNISRVDLYVSQSLVARVWKHNNNVQELGACGVREDIW